MVTFDVPSYRFAEISYAIHVLVSEILGLDYQLRKAETGELTIHHQGSDKKLILVDAFFHAAHERWLQPDTLPSENISYLSTYREKLHSARLPQAIPVIYGKPEIAFSQSTIRCHVDIFGAAFFLLSGYETIACPTKDQHGRMPASASILFRLGILDRPLVNEYAELLYSLMLKLWPQLPRHFRSYRCFITCDIDHPRDAVLLSLKKTARRFFARIIRDKNIPQAFTDVKDFLLLWLDGEKPDDYERNITWIMQVNEMLGNKVIFYMIPKHTHPVLDTRYDYSSPVARRVIDSIISRNHAIGTHPGYNTCDHIEAWSASFDLFRRAASQWQAGVYQGENRQHYLRFDGFQHCQLLEEQGVCVDSSWGFSDHIGFRNGICHEYSMFNFVRGARSAVKQHPLSIMDCALLNESSQAQAYRSAKKIIQTCRQYGGDFVLLWHNSYFYKPKSKVLYKKIIECAR